MNSFFANIGKNIAAKLPIPHGNATTGAKRSDLGDTSPPQLSQTELRSLHREYAGRSTTWSKILHSNENIGREVLFLLIHFRGTIWIGVHFTFAFITESVSYCRVRIVHSDAICFNRPRLLRNQIWSLRKTVRRNDLMNQNFQFTQWMITCFGFFHEERESKKWGHLIHCVTPWEIFWKKSDIFPWLSIMGTYDPELKNGNKQKLRYVWRLKTFV